MNEKIAYETVIHLAYGFMDDKRVIYTGGKRKKKVFMNIFYYAIKDAWGIFPLILEDKDKIIFVLNSEKIVERKKKIGLNLGLPQKVIPEKLFKERFYPHLIAGIIDTNLAKIKIRRREYKVDFEFENEEIAKQFKIMLEYFNIDCKLDRSIVRVQGLKNLKKFEDFPIRDEKRKDKLTLKRINRLKQ